MLLIIDPYFLNMQSAASAISIAVISLILRSQLLQMLQTALLLHIIALNAIIFIIFPYLVYNYIHTIILNIYTVHLFV